MFKFVRNLLKTATTPRPTTPKTFQYRFTFPDDPNSTVIRERNQREARAFVRDALDLTRLPVGTVVERLDN